MVRPKKDIKIKRNNDSLQVFEFGVYVGSIGVKELCLLVRSRGTSAELAQAKYINATKVI